MLLSRVDISHSPQFTRVATQGPDDNIMMHFFPSNFLVQSSTKKYTDTPAHSIHTHTDRQTDEESRKKNHIKNRRRKKKYFFRLFTMFGLFSLVVFSPKNNFTFSFRARTTDVPIRSDDKNRCQPKK